jgi:hypothetical protein
VRSTPTVSEVRFHPANRAHRASGLLGWVTAEIDSVLIDGITLRRTREGRFVLGFPKHVATDGTHYPTVRPRGPAEREAITNRIVGYVRARGWLP